MQSQYILSPSSHPLLPAHLLEITADMHRLSADLNARRIPEERGPFGKARKRGTSRSKTATPATKESQAKLDNLKYIDDIFTGYKQELKTRESLRARKPSGPAGSLPISASAPNLESSLGGGAQITALSTNKDPTEVILYGYGSDVQWAAIDYFERISKGSIYEDYDRYPAHSKYNLSLSVTRASAQRNISAMALRKKNEYVGGDHWIKLTFDSPEAAERACHYSPHNIHGYLVYAERYRGTGPNADVAIRATGNGQSSLTASPNTVSSTTLPLGSISSETASSATATASIPASMQHRHSEPMILGDRPISTPGDLLSQSQPSGTATSVQQRPKASTLRVRGAKPAVLLPPEQAFLPAVPRWQQTVSNLPVIGWVVGSGHGLIGDQVPRKEDGSFDSNNASVYWKFWYMIDTCFGTNVCGCKGWDDED